MGQSKRTGKTQEKHAGTAMHKNPSENPRDGFENYRSGIEITNQVAMDDIPLHE